jgi:hypothetical protein
MLRGFRNKDATSVMYAKGAFNNLEPDKIERFNQAFRSGVIEMPIVIYFNGGYELLSGNTRMTGLVANGFMPKVWFLDTRQFQ